MIEACVHPYRGFCRTIGQKQAACFKWRTPFVRSLRTRGASPDCRWRLDVRPFIGRAAPTAGFFLSIIVTHYVTKRGAGSACFVMDYVTNFGSASSRMIAGAFCFEPFKVSCGASPARAARTQHGSPAPPAIRVAPSANPLTKNSLRYHARSLAIISLRVFACNGPVRRLMVFL